MSKNIITNHSTFKQFHTIDIKEDVLTAFIAKILQQPLDNAAKTASIKNFIIQQNNLLESMLDTLVGSIQFVPLELKIKVENLAEKCFNQQDIKHNGDLALKLTTFIIQEDLLLKDMTTTLVAFLKYVPELFLNKIKELLNKYLEFCKSLTL